MGDKRILNILNQEIGRNLTFEKTMLKWEGKNKEEL